MASMLESRDTMSCPEYAMTIEDNVRLVELLEEALHHGGAALPAWLRLACEAEVAEAGGYRQSAIDQAYRRGRLGAVQLEAR